MKKYLVDYKTEIINSDEIIKPDGFTSIMFRNLGDDDATILENVPLTNPAVDEINQEFVFINRPGEIINTDIPIRFAGVGSTKKILMTKVYYTEGNFAI